MRQKPQGTSDVLILRGVTFQLDPCSAGEERRRKGSHMPFGDRNRFSMFLRRAIAKIKRSPKRAGVPNQQPMRGRNRSNATLIHKFPGDDALVSGPAQLGS